MEAASASRAGLHPLSLKKGYDHLFLPISSGEGVPIPSKCQLKGAHLRPPRTNPATVHHFGFLFTFCILFLCFVAAPSPSPPAAPGKEADNDVIEGASSGHQAFPGPVTDKGVAGSAL